MTKMNIRKGVKNIIQNNRLFTDKDVNPCDVLGIGTNMVKSLRYWMNVVGIMEEVSEGNQKIQRLTTLGTIINTNDKYFEEDGTNWVLHYQLAKNENLATAWYWFFNVFKMTSFNRFEAISIDNDECEIYDIVSTVLSRDKSRFEDYVKQYSPLFVKLKNIIEKDYSFTDAKKTIGQDLALSCYPLHPYTLLLLPQISELVAQNERTIFTFLSSTEKYSVYPNG